VGVLGRYGTSALKYYIDIISAAYANKNTSDMWVDIRARAADYGLPSPQTQAPDVSVIRGYANRIVNGARTLAAAQPSDTITSDMMAVAPYTSRDLNAISVDPVYQVRYQATIQGSDGTVSTRWSTSVYNATQFPSTVGELQDGITTDASEWVAQAAQQTGGESGGTLLGVGNLEITLVLCDAARGSLPKQQRFNVDPTSGTHAGYRDTSHTGIPRNSGTTMLACPRRLQVG
jgi:hypothetical protein